MFSKILIANRGEIACRVIKTARKMGIKTVAVFSEPDAEGLHVRMADEAVAIGPAASTQSYLVIDKIVEACRQTGAEAVHPGYGFLSENTKFAEALKNAGIAFIGPSPFAIRAMGDKIESKKLAAKAGVSTVPGYVGEIETDDEAVRIADEIGYPVMIKASAGGGGKGMRIAHDAQEVRDGFRFAKNEARSSFGDDRVFIEKFITQPRHIEIQVVGDTHGNVIYLAERECSIQRRHQKVIEEAPSPFVDEATRRAMGEQAVSLAKAVDYSSAGTVEFIVDGDRNFYFLEMNTRLQVEHPVTELITGLDLVEIMIRVANGEKLPLTQDDVKIDGWAMETRIYAEDPFRNFLPSTGRIVRYRPPAESDRVRVDAGVYEGGEISMFYDPMIAKLCTHGATRDEAINLMESALDRFQIAGVGHNVPFLSTVMRSDRFREGRLTTGFIAEEFPDGFSGNTLDGDVVRRLLAVAASINMTTARRDAAISGQRSGQRLSVPHDWAVRYERNSVPVRVDDRHGVYVVAIDGHEIEVASDWVVGDDRFEGSVEGETLVVQIQPIGSGWRLLHGGASLDVQVMRPRVADLAALMPIKLPPDLSKYLLSPMPGLLVSLAVEEGHPVKAGQELCVVEAMKMENTLRAELDGVVAKLHAEPGDSLAVDAKIIEFE